MATDQAEDDAALWECALNGDGSAFATLFDRHRDRVFRHAGRVADTRQDAEDVVAAAFLELWRRRLKVRLVNGSVLPWLLVTTTNLGLNQARGIRRHRRLIARLPRDPSVSDPATVIEDSALGIDKRLRAAIRDLSAVDRELFALIALGGLTVTDAPEALDMTVGAAKSRLHRARERVRAQLGGWPPTHDVDLMKGTP